MTQLTSLSPASAVDSQSWWLAPNWRVILLGLWTIWLAYLFFLVYEFGTQFLNWDWMLLSGGAAFLISIWISLRLEQRLFTLIDDLTVKGNLKPGERPVRDLGLEVHQRLKRWSKWGAIAVLVFQTAGIVTFYRPDLLMQSSEICVDWSRLTLYVVWVIADGAQSGSVCQENGQPGNFGGWVQELVIWQVFGLSFVCTFCGWFAGLRLGAAAACGSFAWAIQKSGARLVLHPNYPDGAAGLSGIGRFYRYSALLVFVPVAWIAIWWTIPPYWSNVDAPYPVIIDYTVWQDYFAALWLLSMVFFVSGFVVPLYGFHRLMEQSKRRMLGDHATVLAHDVDTALAVFRAKEPADKVCDAWKHLSESQSRLHYLEEVPTWPISPRTLIDVGVKYLLLTVVPIVLRFQSGNVEDDIVIKLVELLLSLVVLGG